MNKTRTQHYNHGDFNITLNSRLDRSPVRPGYDYRPEKDILKYLNEHLSNMQDFNDTLLTHPQPECFTFQNHNCKS